MMEPKVPSGAPGDDSEPAEGREALWRRLDALLGEVTARGFGRLSDEEVEELGRLYRAASNHLALLKTFKASARQREALNRLVARGHGVIYGRPRKGENLTAFLWSLLGFPETVRATARYHLLAAGILLAGAIYGYAGSARDPEWALELTFPGDERTPYASRAELRETLLAGRPGAAPGEEARDEEAKSGRGAWNSQVKAIFAAGLWQHNTRVALLMFFSGFLAGLPTVLLLLKNGAMLGSYSRTFHAQDLAYEWWAWILPHGVTEILAIVLLAGGGLFLGHRLIAPGDSTRLEALRRARGDALRLLLFAFPMLLAAALIEAFVRQSGLSDPGRYIFAGASAVFWALYLAFGGAPRAVLARREARKTLAERAVPLPVDEEILPILRSPRSR